MEFGIEGRDRRFKRGQLIELPDTIDDSDGVTWTVEWVEVTTLDDQALGNRVFTLGMWWRQQTAK